MKKCYYYARKCVSINNYANWTMDWIMDKTTGQNPCSAIDTVFNDLYVYA